MRAPENRTSAYALYIKKCVFIKGRRRRTDEGETERMRCGEKEKKKSLRTNNNNPKRRLKRNEGRCVFFLLQAVSGGSGKKKGLSTARRWFFFFFPFVYVETQYTYSFQVESRDLGGWWRKRAQAEETGFSSFPGLGIFTEDLSLALRKHQKKRNWQAGTKTKRRRIQAWCVWPCLHSVRVYESTGRGQVHSSFHSKETLRVVEA